MEQFNELFIGNSSNISKMEYDEDLELLRVTFNPSKKQVEAGEGGAVYVYKNVNYDIVHDFRLAVELGESVGSLFHKTIVKNPTDFPVEKQ